MSRSELELTGLSVEAERLVREGMSRAEVSRALGVPAQTLAGWALRHGWRKKDLEAERADAAIGRAVKRIGQARAAGAEAREKMAGRWRAFREAVELAPAEPKQGALQIVMDSVSRPARDDSTFEAGRLHLSPMPEAPSRELTLKMLRERRERLMRELAALERDGPISARESLTWRTRLAELEARIARWAEG